MNFEDLSKENGAPWRNSMFGDSEFRRLQLLLQWCYNTCKDIDSGENYEKWPGAVRYHVAEALDAIMLFNRTHKCQN